MIIMLLNVDVYIPAFPITTFTSIYFKLTILIYAVTILFLVLCLLITKYSQTFSFNTHQLFNILQFYLTFLINFNHQLNNISFNFSVKCVVLLCEINDTKK